MGTRKNRKNRNRKTKRKLIKGDPVTFLKSLKTPEQIRKHSLFKKRTIKRNMRGGGQPDTRKKNIKKIIKTINKKYKNTEWNLKNIEEEYKKANIEPNFLQKRFINTYEQKSVRNLKFKRKGTPPMCWRTCPVKCLSSALMFSKTKKNHTIS